MHFPIKKKLNKIDFMVMTSNVESSLNQNTFMIVHFFKEVYMHLPKTCNLFLMKQIVPLLPKSVKLRTVILRIKCIIIPMLLIGGQRLTCLR